MPGRPDRDALRELHALGQQAWPEVTVEFEAFAAHAERGIEPEALPRVRADELYLVVACCSGDPEALRLLQERYLATLEAAVAQLGHSPSTVDEVMQQLRIRFLTGDRERAPRIAEYNGVGSLRSWLRVAAVRLAVSDWRKQRRETPLEEGMLLDLPATEASPELDLLKRTYRAEFEVAFRTAVRSLSPRERNLLRHQLLDGMSIDRIGALYGVHRATAARWVARARAAVIAGVKRELQAELGVPQAELDSILALIRSQLDLSLGAFLSESGSGAAQSGE